MSRPHDVIYIQYEEYPDPTWCQDQINDDDAEYLLATPERKAAPDLLEALQVLLESWDEYGISLFPDPIADKARAALAKYTGNDLS